MRFLGSVISLAKPTFCAGQVSYQDTKRLAWLFSIAIPLSLGFPPLVYWLTGSVLALWIPFLVVYTAIPIADVLMGEDQDNPPEAVVPQLEADPYYRWTCYLLIPVLWAVFLFNAYFVGTTELPWHGVLAMAMTTGLMLGSTINLGHELGHKRSKLDQWLASFVLALAAYGHFAIEHNRGHHRDVATPEDSASSRMGESVYVFALREMAGGFRRAWQLERERLQRRGFSVFSWDNEILRAALLTLLLTAGLFVAFGSIMLPYLAVAFFVGAFHLTLANYVEHYGLLRQKRPDGQYERCKPHHSWNSNHIVSNWASFHLQRHSDHHAHPTRSYQALRHFDDLPTLPNGYLGMFPIALIPPLWFRIMDPLLLEHTNREPSRINFCPRRRAALIARYQLADDTRAPITS